MKIKLNTLCLVLGTSPAFATPMAPNPATQGWVLQQLAALKAQLVQVISSSAGTPCTSADKRCAIFATYTRFQGDMTVDAQAASTLPPGFTGFTDNANTSIGALSRATQICNTEGRALIPGSSWKPWISFSTASDVPSASQNAASTLNAAASYYQKGGGSAYFIGTGTTLIGPDPSIVYLHTGINGSSENVYTGTNAQGQIYDNGDPTNASCEDWTNLSGESTQGLQDGASFTWTMANTFESCTDNLSIYCVQQVKG